MRGARSYILDMLHIAGLHKAYGDLVAVRSLDLRAEPGEVCALLGPNGAGKSTTVQCVTGLLAPNSGSITVNGIDIATHPADARRRMSYVPEVAALYDELTPAEYLMLRGRLFDLDDGAIRERTERILDGFGIGDRRDSPIAEFSKGMTQKVALAAALLTEPKLLILDEPLSGLDVETTLVFKELVREIAARGAAVLYCSHMLDVVETLADRVVVIDRGEVMGQGSLEELRSSVAGGSPDARLEELFRTLTSSADPALRAKAILGNG